MKSSIVVGEGCFWCTEAVFKMFPGVLSVTSGYAGGHLADPTYEQVCNGDTGHAEVLKIEYESGKISLRKILEIFFASHDPTSLNRQGADVGTQYRSIILYNGENERKAAEEAAKDAQRDFDKPIVTEIKKLDRFYPAEDYHKDFYEKNPKQPYCVFVIRPKLTKIKKEFGPT